MADHLFNHALSTLLVTQRRASSGGAWKILNNVSINQSIRVTLIDSDNEKMKQPQRKTNLKVFRVWETLDVCVMWPGCTQALSLTATIPPA